MHFNNNLSIFLFLVGEKTLQVLEKGSELDYDVVSDAYVHALTGKYPRYRYVIGKDANRIFVPLSWLPESWSDYLITMHSNVPDSICDSTSKDQKWD